MIQEKKLLVSAIKNGTVIDHVACGQAFTIIRLLNLLQHKKIVTVGLNLPSKSMGCKDLIKVEGIELTPNEANRVAIFSPESSVNIIRNYNVIKKFFVTIPEKISRLIVCPNPKCITNHDRMESLFLVRKEGKEIKLHCYYCEKTFSNNEINQYGI